MHHSELSDEELSCINQFLSAGNSNPLCPPFQVITYPKVAVNKTIICSLSVRTTTRNNHTIVYIMTSSGVLYGILQKLITVHLRASESLHLALINTIVVGPCTPLQQITFPMELANYSHTITSDFVSAMSQSSNLIAVATDDIIMNIFDINVALTPLVNETEKAV